MWFILSLSCAFLTATTATLTKYLIKNNNEYIIVWLRYLICLPVFIILFILIPKTGLGPAFWKNILIMLPFELCAILIYLKSIKISPLSLTFPFLGFTPVFSILASYLFLGERIKLHGIFGISLVTMGAYMLNANLIKQGPLEPIKKIYREKGSILMVIVAFIFSITSTLGKKGIILSGVLIFPVIYYSIFLITYMIFILFFLNKDIKSIKLNKKHLLILIASSFTFILTIVFHFWAISMIEAAYMISVKRLSLLFSVIYGALIFKEKFIRYRLLGATIMVAGVLVLLM